MFIETHNRHFNRILVQSFESALAFRNGAFNRELGPGTHTVWGRGWQFVVQDLRPQTLLIPSQEIMTKDNLTVKVSVIVSATISNPMEAYMGSDNLHLALHSAGQLALRAAVATMTLDDIVQASDSLVPLIQAPLELSYKRLGHKVVEVAIRDVTLPAPLKRAQMAIALAQKEGQAALEKARFETAALRSLINAANLVKEHPELAQLRMLQVLQDSKAQIQIVPQIPL